LLVLILAGWFVLVSPQSSKAAALDAQIGEANVKLATTQSFLQSPESKQSVTDLRRLRRAIPDDVEMSEILRQLAWASRPTGVKGGKPYASGRLYGIDNISLSAGDKGGLIMATLALNAFVSGSTTAPAPGSTTTEP